MHELNGLYLYKFHFIDNNGGERTVLLLEIKLLEERGLAGKAENN